ncbi:MAG: hypothetical protein C4309_11270, partial [Chloroflexota bacterium]
MPVTIRDVAKRLNLSITTVSRALDGYDDVAAETRQRVIAVAREMGYIPSHAARQMRRQRTETLGYILPTALPRFADPFFSEFIAGLGDEATLHNFDLLVSTAPPGSTAEQALYRRWVQGRRVDGMVLSRMRLDDWRVRYLHEAGLPLVASGRSRTPVDFPYVEVDSRSGFAALVAHLVARGHRRIAYIGAPATLTLQADRFAGYCDGLAAAGITFDPSLVTEGNLTRMGGYQAAQRLLALPQRVMSPGLPQVQVVDMRQELRAGNRSIFSRALQSALADALVRGEQAILFLNRRGTATFVLCRDCGYVLSCPRCDLPLTYHGPQARLVC